MKKKQKKTQEQTQPYSPPEVMVHELDDDVFQFVVGGCTSDCGNTNCGCAGDVLV